MMRRVDRRTGASRTKTRGVGPSLAWLLVCLLGCNACSERADRQAAASAGARGTRIGHDGVTSVAARPSARASGERQRPASASAAAPEALAGSWAGSYDAKKGEVHLPPKVKDKAIAADDGKASSGPGSVELTIGPSGEVRGKTSGALGAGTLTGHAEGSTLRASIWPDDPQRQRQDRQLHRRAEG